MAGPTDQSVFQWAEDAPHVSGQKGTAALVVRKDVAASLADTDGDYTLLQVNADGALLARVNFAGGSLANGTETSVTATAAQILAANTARKILVVQNVGNMAARIGVSGVTAVTGIKLAVGATLILDSPHCPTNAIFAIRDGGANTTVFAAEVS